MSANFVALAEAGFGLTPAFVSAGKFDQAKAAILAILPHVDDLKTFTPMTILTLHDSGSLKAIASLTDALDGALTADPKIGPHVITLLEALGLGKSGG